MNSINDILSGYKKITLEQVSIANLMSRVETKFTFHRSQLPEILAQLKNDYKVLEVNKCRLNPYETLYFDTPSFYLYLLHHNSIFNRYKIRKRRYISSGDSFIEIKKRNNKNRVNKARVAIESMKEYLEVDNLDFINSNTNIDSSLLKPTLWVYFYRITLVNWNYKERITIDVDITFKYNSKTVSYPEIVIAEVKQEINFRSSFMILMKNNSIHSDSSSKYCLGLASLNENIKKNNFKRKLLMINKINNQNRDLVIW